MLNTRLYTCFSVPDFSKLQTPPGLAWIREASMYIPFVNGQLNVRWLRCYSFLFLGDTASSSTNPPVVTMTGSHKSRRQIQSKRSNTVPLQFQPLQGTYTVISSTAGTYGKWYIAHFGYLCTIIHDPTPTAPFQTLAGTYNTWRCLYAIWYT